MNVISIDPGGNTGIVIGVAHGREFEVVSWAEERDQIKTCLMVEELMQAKAVDTVIIERWVSMNGVRSFEPEALEIIGTVRYLCAVYSVPMVMQGSADAKAFGRPDRVRPYQNAEGGHVGYRGGGHALMALRHLLLWNGTRKLETFDGCDQGRTAE